jgi:hypothetical protein
VSSNGSDRPAGIFNAERLSQLALAPVVATLLYYALPTALQEHRTVQFLPQITAYVALLLWAQRNIDIAGRLGTAAHLSKQGLWWGLPTGLALGVFNVWVILSFVPSVGGDITFLRETPHAHLPAAFMLPWGIWMIAAAVELNFRGFLLGRLVTWLQESWLTCHPEMAAFAAVAISAVMFACDPFMVHTFRHLHWIALWDGIVWGIIWLRLRNLYATITAHAVEVMVMYVAIKIVLS